MDMQTCLTNCQNCETVCRETLEYCRDRGDDFLNTQQIQLLEDCAKICETSADFLERESKNHTVTCGACAEICGKCADMCKEFTEDEQMMKCAEACRTCAKSCEEMSA